MLSLYFNYLSTVTLREFANTQNTKCGLVPDARGHAVQFDCSLSSQRPLNHKTENASGVGLWRETKEFRGPRNRGASHQPGLDQIRHARAFRFPLSEQMREKDDTDGKIKAGRLKSHFFQKRKKKNPKKLNSRLLYLLSMEINKVLGLQVCWFGDLDDATKGAVGGQSPGRRQGGPPSVVPLPPVQSPAPAESRASFALSGRAPCPAGAGGDPRVHGLGAQHWLLQWLEGLKLQSTARG